MEEKDREKDKSKETEEVPPINADPNLDKVVLHNLLGTSTEKIIKLVIDPKNEDLVMNKDKETSTPQEETQTQQPSKIQAVPELDRIVKKGLDPDREERQKPRQGRK